MTYGVKTNIMRSKVGDAIMWEHDTLAYLALDNAPGFKDNAYLSVDPFVSFNNAEKGIKHSLNTRYFRVNIYPGYEDSTQYTNATAKRFSSVYYTDYQVQKQIKDLERQQQIIEVLGCTFIRLNNKNEAIVYED